MGIPVEEAYGKPNFKYMIMDGLSPNRDYFTANTLEEAKEKGRNYIGKMHDGRRVEVVKVLDVVESWQSLYGTSDVGYMTRGVWDIFEIDGKIEEYTGNMQEFLHVGWFLSNYDCLDDLAEEELE